MLWPVNFTLAYVGYEVLPPFVAYGVESGLRYSDPTAIEDRRRAVVADFRATLPRLAERETIPFNRMEQWGPDGRGRGGHPGLLAVRAAKKAARFGVIASPSSLRILVIGDVMTDVIVRPDGPLARGSDRRAKIAFEPGGSAANQAAWLASFGVAVDLVARVGAADVEAEAARLRRAGVTPHLARDPERPTGRLVALIDPNGERGFFTDRGANEALEAADIPDALIAAASHIHLSGYSFFSPRPCAAVLDVMRRAGATAVSVDPASAEFLREVGPKAFLECTRGAAILFPNEDEAAALAGSDDPESQCALLAALFSLVVVKRGAAGCVAAQGARRWRVPAPKVEAVDATGAGDAFVAAFLAARLRGDEIQAALERAVAAGSKAVTQVGGRPKGANLTPA